MAGYGVLPVLCNQPVVLLQRAGVSDCLRRHTPQSVHIRRGTGDAGSHRTVHTACAYAPTRSVQTFLNFNATAASNAQAIQQELPAMMSTADARAVEGLTITATLFTALALAGCTVSEGAHDFDGCGIVSGKDCDC